MNSNEAHAKRSLEHGTISCLDVEDLLRKVAAFIPANTQRKNILDADMQPVKSQAFGLYRYAGSMGITTLTKDMPNSVKVLNAFFKQEEQGGTFVWSSITVNWNVQSAPQKDANNMGPSKITAFGPFKGGRLWTKTPMGTHLALTRGLQS